MNITGDGYNTVTEAHSGIDMMYRVHQSRGIDYVVNSKHILSLHQTRAKQHKVAIPGFKSAEKRRLELLPYDRTVIHDFPVEFYLSQSENFRKRYTCFKKNMIQLPAVEVPVDPYYFGLWIGDGSSKSYYEITNIDGEILDYFYEYANKLGTYAEPRDRITHRMKVSTKRLCTPINEKVAALKEYFYSKKLINNKYVPEDFIYTSYENRLKFLAGLIDTDGCKTKRNTLSITQKNRRVLEAVVEICRLSGFYTNGVTEKIAKMRRADGSIYQCKVYIVEINHNNFIDLNRYIRCARKRVEGKSCDRDYFTSSIKVEPEGLGEYFGFTLDNSPYFLLEDGTVCHNSGKTRNTVIWLCAYLMNHPGLRLSVVRKTLTALRGSVLIDFKEVLIQFGVWNWNVKAFNKSEFIFTFPNGSWIEFFSTDDEQKIRGRKRDICYCNEANELSQLEWQQLKMRTTMFTIADYNPSFSDEHWLCAVNNDPRTYHFITTYKDNPFLEQTIIDEIESLQYKNKSLWQVYGLGMQAVVEGLIFTNVEIIDEIPAYAKKYHWRGMDFGYSQDPTAILDVYFHDNTLYFDEICYNTEMLASDIIKVLKEHDGAVETITESADPRLIQEIYRGGCNVKPVVKYGGSIQAGVTKMLEYKICVTKQSTNVIKELKNYTWAQDKEGRWLNQPIDAFNHCFEGGTMIETTEGQKRISDIRPGDYVMTSGGYRQVLENHNNGYRKVFYFSLFFGKFKVEVCCTPDHKIKTTKGWKEIQNLKPGDELFISRERLNALQEQSSMEKLTSCIKENDTIQRETNGSMSPFGNTITGLSRKVMRFTTRISIRLTTIYQTLNVLLSRNTGRSTTIGVRNGVGDQNKSNTLERLGKRQASGIRAKKGANGTQSTQGRWKHKSNRGVTLAYVAEQSFGQRIQLPSSVPITANQNGAETKDLITRYGYANGAERSSSLTDIQRQDTVVPLALQSITAVSKPGATEKEVYDLTIEGIHEYIANGIVVHNCIDAARYVVMMKIMGGRPKPVSMTRLANIAY